MGGVSGFGGDPETAPCAYLRLSFVGFLLPPITAGHVGGETGLVFRGHVVAVRRKEPPRGARSPMHRVHCLFLALGNNMA